MPPIRRKPPAAARPSGRRPKIAGAAQANRTAPAEGTAAEATEVITPEVQPEVAETQAVELEKATEIADVPAETATEGVEAATEGAETVEVTEAESTATVTAEPAATETPEAPEVAGPHPAPRRRIPRPRVGWPLVAVLLAIAVVCGGFAGVVAWKQPAKVNNVAYLDDVTTTQVTAAAKTIVQKIFSYDYKTIDQHAGEIKGDITPPMLDQYNKFFAPSSDAIKQDKSHVDAAVDQGNIGVKMLEGNLAQVELILNVTSSNDGVTGPAAQVPLLVNLERSGGRWIVTGLHQL